MWKLPNPLFIDVILLEIYRKLDLKDLLTCRLVCHKWNELGTPIVQTHGPRIFFEEQEDLNKILPIIKELNGGGLVVGKSQFILYDKLILKIQETYAEYEDLIEKCAPTLKFLEVVGGPAGQKAEFTLRDWIARMPELETLKINCPVLYGVTELFFPGGPSAQLESLREFSLRKIGGRGDLSSTFFDGFFERCQNLKRLSFDVNLIVDGYPDLSDEDEDDPDSRPVANRNLDVILKSLEDKGNLEKLKSMKFSRLASSHLSALLRLSRIGLNLTSFELTDALSSQALKLLEFISVQKGSLTKLVVTPICIIVELYRKGYREVMVGMSCLEELEFFMDKFRSYNRLGFVQPNEAPHPPSFCFPEMFPNLTKLSLRGFNMSDFMEEFFAEGFEIIPCKTLRHLRLPPGKLTGKEAIAENFSRLFPDITSLDVRRPSNEFLHGIWKFWPDLTDLKVVCVGKPKAVLKPKFAYRNVGGELRFCYIKPYGKRIKSKGRGFFSRLGLLRTFSRVQHEAGAFRHCHYLDHGFTGIDENICAEMEIFGWNPDIRGADIVNQFKIKPSITDLKKLKRVNLHFESVMKTGHTFRAKLVSDIFIHTALLEMPQLEELVITERLLNAASESSVHNQTSDLSLEAVQNLRQRLTSTKIQIRSNRVGPDWRTPNFHPQFEINLNDIADFDQKPYTVLTASSICG